MTEDDAVAEISGVLVSALPVGAAVAALVARGAIYDALDVAECDALAVAVAVTVLDSVAAVYDAGGGDPVDILDSVAEMLSQYAADYRR